MIDNQVLFWVFILVWVAVVGVVTYVLDPKHHCVIEKYPHDDDL